jgi:hypothetical protein
VNSRGLEYEYGGQWFDDMGALALSFADSPMAGVDLANNPLDRLQTNQMAKNLLGSGLNPYYDDSVGTMEG